MAAGTERQQPPHRRWSLGLRGRVTLAFGALALAVSALLALLAWTVVTRSIVAQTTQAGLSEAVLDRGVVEGALGAGISDVPSLLDSLPGSDALGVLASVDGHWYATRPSLGPSNVPSRLLALARGGQEATQRVIIDGRLYLAVALPLEHGRGLWVELYPMSEAQRAVRTVALGLVAAATVTSAAGLAVGRFASKVALRPLTELNTVASEVAAGQLDARLDARDDPDLAELATTFNRSVEDLQRRVVADARFAVDVSHELRTPLTTMLNSMQLIRNREDQLPGSLREPVSLLSDELERFRQLVVDLLEISRDDAGDQLVLEPANIGELVRRAADEEAGAEVTVVGKSAAGLVMEVDKRRLERVVANLVANAQRHGGGCRAVLVECSDHTLHIVVDDAGPGIPTSRRERVFERFSRGGADTATGSGLGLAIVHRHLSLLGGRVAVEDRPGGGARLVVDLPTGPS